MDSTTIPISTLLTTHFTRLEKALETLIKSIATYNPSPPLALDLITADSELNSGLEKLHTHQTNHQRILALRAQSQTLDTQIKDNLLLLTTTRSEVLATPGTKFPSSSEVYPVSYEELLSYARRISRTTVPGTYREPDQTPKEELGATEGSGNGTPAAVVVNGGVAEVEKVEDEGEHSRALPPQFAAATTLPPTVFTPWPHDILLRRGALATLQALGDRGVEIEGWEFDGEEGEVVRAEIEEEKRRVEEERVEEEERRRRLSTVAVGVVAGSGGAQAAQRKKQFELETFEDDSGDED